MLTVHTLGTPLTYAYLFFVKFKKPLHALKAQELADFHKQELEGNTHLKPNEKEVLAPLGVEERLDAKQHLPGYMANSSHPCVCRRARKKGECEWMVRLARQVHDEAHRRL